MASFTLGAIGSFFFGPIGGIIGTFVGGFIDQALFGQDQTFEGPRLSDRDPKGSTYGTMIPINYGTDRFPGFPIYAEKIREVRKEEDVGGKGGGPSATQVSYSYFGTWAVGLCEGPQSQVLKVWMNKKLIYDFTSNRIARRKYLGGRITDAEAELIEAVVGPKGKQVPIGNPKVRIYLGGETQIADPRIQARKGVDNTPAHRGLCYLMFRNIPLEDFGNTIPQVEALVYSGAVNERLPERVVDQNVSVDFGTEVVKLGSNTTLYIGRTRDQPVFSTGGDSAFDGYRIWDYGTATLIANRQLQFPMSPDARDFAGGFLGLGAFYGAGPFVIDDGKFFYTIGTTLGDTGFIHKWRTDDGLLISSTGIGGSPGFPLGTFNAPAIRAGCLGGIYPNQRMVYTAAFTILNIEGEPGEAAFAPGASQVAGDMPLHLVDTSGRDFGSWQLNGGIPIVDNDGEVWMMAPSFGTATGWYLLRINVYSKQIEEQHFYDSTVDVDLVPSSIGRMGYHPGLNAILYSGSGKIWRIDLGERDGNNRPTPFPGGGVDDRNGGGDQPFYNSLYESPSIFFWNHGLGAESGDNVSGLNPVTMTLVDIRPNVGGTDFFQNAHQFWPSAPADVEGYDINNHALIFYRGSDSNFVLGLMDRVDTPDVIDLQSVVTDISARVGVEGAEIDAAELTDLLDGYSIRRRMSARAALGPLQTAFAFDGVESDYRMKFPKRGRASSLAILEDELAAKAGGGSDDVARISTRRLQEVELPQRVEVLHTDPNFNYQPNTQYASRSTEATKSVDKASIDLSGIVLNVNDSREAAARVLFTAHHQRETHELVTGMKHIQLDPADVFTTEIDGRSYRIMIEEADLTPDYTLKIVGKPDNAGTYDSIITGGAAEEDPEVNEQGQVYDGLSQFFWLDAPMLRNQDDEFGVYLTAGPLVDNPTEEGEWNGATVFQATSADGPFSSVTFVSASRKVTWGTIEEDITGPQTTHWDRDSVLKVRLNSGTLDSKTENEVLQSENMLAIQTPDGDVEYVQFATALDNGDGTWELTDLIWGRRGTDWFTATGHVAGERWCLVTPGTTQEAFPTESLLNVELFHRAVTNGGDPLLFIQRSEPFDAIRLKPYRVANPQAVDNGDGSATISWVDRSRINNGPRNLAGPYVQDENPLTFEVDVIDPADNSVKRTLSVTDATTLNYTDKATDFGAGPAAIRFTIYKLSDIATIGRGFARSVDLTMAANVDPSFASVSLLVSFDGSDGQASTVDESTTGHTISFIGTAELDSEFKKFGTTSLLPNGSRCEVADSAEHKFGSGDFTVEGFVRFTGTMTDGVIMGRYDTGSDFREWALSVNGSQAKYLYSSNGTATTDEAQAGPSINDGVWHHLAYVRDVDTLRLYVDGVQAATDAVSGAINEDVQALTIGSGVAGNEFTGNIDEIRITKGVCRYPNGTTFIPPAAPFPES